MTKQTPLRIGAGPILTIGVGLALMAHSAPQAAAGGFAIREQSAYFQGLSFAGSAAGGSLSSMYWNSAATANFQGRNLEASAAVIIPHSEVTVSSVNVSGVLPPLSPATAGPAFAAAPAEANGIGPTALVAATYGNYQIGNVFVGMAVNAPFGLTTEPNNYTYKGSVIAQTTRLIAFNANPTVAMRIAPGISIGAGAQIQTAEGTFRFATGVPQNATTSVEGNGWGFGATAGILIEPTSTTRIGVGYRSRIDQEINGYIYTGNFSLGQRTTTTLNLPDIVTVSLSQVVSPVLRLHGTFEWTNWSRFKDLTVTAAETGRSALGAKSEGQVIASLPFNWSDGYFVSVGVEYDFAPQFTARMGVAYEKSPIDSPEKRSPGIPDNDRYWLSFGASYQVNALTRIDLGYSHLFVDQADFNRTSLSNVIVTGGVDSSVDIFSASLKTSW